ncbi:hypothetical protein ABID65_006730 [Bradyrhizobium sp. S3.9.2]|uniref:hypothetical protein n=1 Tax=Bradyrhizobium sp. S3.9.2 TaxID=3156432 RepID=UPI003399D8A3
MDGMTATDIDEMIDRVMTENWQAHQRGILPTWTIFHRPRDWPKGYVARRFEINADGGEATDTAFVGDDTPEALTMLRHIFSCAGLVCLKRNHEDHGSVVETWV